MNHILSGLRIYGNKDPESTLNGKRTPTFALRMDGLKTAEELGTIQILRNQDFDLLIPVPTQPVIKAYNKLNSFYAIATPLTNKLGTHKPF